MLARGVTGQHAEGRHRVVERGDQLVDAAHRDMHAGQRGDHAGVAFVGHEADSAGFGHGEVHAGNAHVGFGELAAQLAAGHAQEQSLACYLPENLDELTYVPLGMEEAVENFRNRARKGKKRLPQES